MALVLQVSADPLRPTQHTLFCCCCWKSFGVGGREGVRREHTHPLPCRAVVVHLPCRPLVARPKPLLSVSCLLGIRSSPTKP